MVFRAFLGAYGLFDPSCLVVDAFVGKEFVVKMMA